MHRVTLGHAQIRVAVCMRRPGAQDGRVQASRPYLRAVHLGLMGAIRAPSRMDRWQNAQKFSVIKIIQSHAVRIRTTAHHQSKKKKSKTLLMFN